MEVRDKVLSSVDAQDMNTSGYQLSADLDDVEAYWENDQLSLDAVFRQGTDATLFPSTFNDFEMRSMAENPSPIDAEEDKENCPPPHPKTPVSQRPTKPPLLIRGRFSEQEKVTFVPDCVYRKFVE